MNHFFIEFIVFSILLLAYGAIVFPSIFHNVVCLIGAYGCVGFLWFAFGLEYLAYMLLLIYVSVWMILFLWSSMWMAPPLRISRLSRWKALLLLGASIVTFIGLYQSVDYFYPHTTMAVPSTFSMPTDLLALSLFSHHGDALVTVGLFLFVALVAVWVLIHTPIGKTPSSLELDSISLDSLPNKTQEDESC